MRLDERMVLIRPIESWFEDCEVIATGLEVKGTSCHNLESVAVEEILERFGVSEGKGIQKVLNKSLGASLDVYIYIYIYIYYKLYY